MKFKWSVESKNRSKSFIAEKLARIYISKREYVKAADVLKYFIKGKAEYYIRYTYSTACIQDVALLRSPRRARGRLGPPSLPARWIPAGCRSQSPAGRVPFASERDER
jgi:hypothetical protein